MNVIRTVPIVATATFLLAFAVADLTGVRPLGGVVLVVGGAWCALQVRPVAGLARTAALLAVALAAFVASHPLGDVVGAWPAVLAVSLAVGAVTAGLVGSVHERGARGA